MDGDGDIDFAEWRKELKARGYSDLEIETVFAKYDQDGDKVCHIPISMNVLFFKKKFFGVFVFVLLT